jgi:hypothetical protein
MLFKRRTPPTWAELIRVWLWPRRSWSRSVRYVVSRIVRQRTSPHSLALGCATGVFAACTPLIGGQFVLAAMLALLLRASVPAAMLATFFGNPLSWSLIWPATYLTGSQLLGGGPVQELSELPAKVEVLWQALFARSPEMLAAAAGFLWPLLKPMLAGSLPIGLVAGVAMYYMMRAAAEAARLRRQRLRVVRRAIAPANETLAHAAS